MPEFKFAGQWHVQGGTDLMGSDTRCPVEEKTLRIKVTNVFVDAPLHVSIGRITISLPHPLILNQMFYNSLM